MAANLADRNYEEIDRDLLGTSEITVKDVKKPNNLVATAKGYMFFETLQSLQNMLRKFNHRYWQ